MADLHDSKRPRAVIAEDFVLIQENIRRVLTDLCDIIATVEDGASALAAVAEHVPEIVLLDVSLPDMSGFLVAERLLASNPAVLVIFVTAHRDRMFAERAFEIGAKGYVLKGAMWKELPEAIQAVTTGRQYRSALIPVA